MRPAKPIVYTVLGMFILWVGVTAADLAACRIGGGVCPEQRSELKTAITTATGTLLGWLTSSPLDTNNVP
jgi:hypothetical protein